MAKPPRDEHGQAIRKDGKPYASSTGSFFPEVDMTNWRVKLRCPNRVKFDDEKKMIYLENLLQNGKKMLAAQAADIDSTTVTEHYKNDPEFAKLVDEVQELYAQSIVNKIEQEAKDGYDEPVINKEGDIVGYRRKWETRLRELLIKRHDPMYKDRQEIDMNHKGGSGVLVVPAGVTMDEFRKESEAQRQKMLERQAAEDAEQS